MACFFHSGRAGWKEILPPFSTPRGTVTKTTSPRKICEDPVSVDVLCTSTPEGVGGVRGGVRGGEGRGEGRGGEGG